MPVRDIQVRTTSKLIVQELAAVGPPSLAGSEMLARCLIVPRRRFPLADRDYKGDNTAAIDLRPVLEPG